MNAQEIIEKLAELKIKDKHLAWEDFDSDEQAAALAENIGEYKIVYSKGGNEGGGDTMIRVFEFVGHDVFLKATGYYASYNGTDWDGEFTEVRPHEKVITVYK